MQGFQSELSDILAETPEKPVCDVNLSVLTSCISEYMEHVKKLSIMDF